LGEFGLIDRISRQVRIQNSSTVAGIGDDAAVISADPENYTLLSTDMLVEGIHFDLSYVPVKHLGYKAVAVNVSDIAAMNGRPEQIVVSLAVSNRFSLEAIDELYAGMQAACENYNVDLVGGDTTSSRSGLIISLTVVGKAPREKVAYRRGSPSCSVAAKARPERRSSRSTGSNDAAAPGAGYRRRLADCPCRRRDPRSRPVASTGSLPSSIGRMNPPLPCTADTTRAPGPNVPS
jgi:hypothetical protein